MICLVGRPCTYRYEVAKALKDYGYEIIKPYKQVEQVEGKQGQLNLGVNSDYKYISKLRLDTLEQQGKLVLKTEIQGEVFGIPHPVGYSKYVIVATPEIVEKLKNIYKKQIITVLIDTERKIPQFNGQEKSGVYQGIDQSYTKFMSAPFTLNEREEQLYRLKADIVVENSAFVDRTVMRILVKLNESKELENDNR